jgi:hypothetical protein
VRTRTGDGQQQTGQRQKSSQATLRRHGEKEVRVSLPQRQASPQDIPVCGLQAA